MTPKQKLQKLNEMESRSRSRKQALNESTSPRIVNESTYVWHNDELILVPKSALD
jgi:hypothetical protein